MFDSIEDLATLAEKQADAELRAEEAAKDRAKFAAKKRESEAVSLWDFVHGQDEDLPKAA